MIKHMLHTAANVILLKLASELVIPVLDMLFGITQQPLVQETTPPSFC